MVLQGQLVDDADEGWDVGAEPVELLILTSDCPLQLDDRGPEAGFGVRSGSSFLDPFVELVLQVQVALGERVAGDLCFLGKGDDGGVPLECCGVWLRRRSIEPPPT